MAAVSGHIQNLINGVSQQPAGVRLPTQVEEQVNGYSTISGGLRKRPPSQTVAKISDFGSAPAMYHVINRDQDGRFEVSFRYGAIKVIDLNDGSEKEVTYPDGKGYLTTSDPARDFRAVTVADYTFLVNRSVVVSKKAALSPSENPEALIHVVSAGFDKTYQVFINDALVAEVVLAPDSGTDVQTPRIAAMLSGLSPAGSPNTTITTALTDNLPPANWHISVFNNVVHVQQLQGNDFTLRVKADGDNNFIRSHKGITSSFADLPTHGPDNFVIKVLGDKATRFDDYYVKLTKDELGDGKGVWKETVAPGIQTAFYPNSMPHALVREADGTFTFGNIDWGARAVGDEDSVPWPSFVGRTLNGVVFHRNRLGFIADENVILSRSGEFFEFWPETVTTVLDTDPIDIAVSHPKVSILHHAIPYGKDLILFSGLTQFRLAAGDILTPHTAHAPVLTEYRSDTAVAPVACGTSMFFAVDGTQSTSLRELLYDESTGLRDGPSITNHCPRYIPTGLTKLAAGSNTNIVAALASEQPTRVYVYKFYWSNQQKLQSSWSYWEMGDDVIDCEFLDNDLVILMQRGGEVWIERIPCDEGYRDEEPEMVICLDRRVHSDDIPRSYSSGTGRTAFTLPYDAPADVAVVDASDETGRNYPVVERSGSRVYVDGDLTSEEVYIGTPYTFEVTFSEFVARRGRGDQSVPIVGGNLDVQEVTLYAMSGYFRAEVSQLYRDTFSAPFTGPLMGDPRNLIGHSTPVWHGARVPIMADSKEFTLKIINDSYLPCAVLNADWAGEHYR